MRSIISAAFVVLLSVISAGEHAALAQQDKVSELLAPTKSWDVQHSAVGVTRQGTPIDCLFNSEDLDLKTKKTRVLLIGGLDGQAASVQSTLEAMKWYLESEAAKELRKRYLVSAIPCANPDGLNLNLGAKNNSGGMPGRGYPPQGSAYNSQTDPESAYLWRWIGMHAPDLVVEVQAGEKKTVWSAPSGGGEALQKLIDIFDADVFKTDDRLVSQLVRVAPCDTGTIPAMCVAVARENEGWDWKFDLLLGPEKSSFRGPSPARRELQQRLDRTPLEVAGQLSKFYGHDLGQVAYIPAVALMGRVRLSQLTGDPSHLKDVEKIVSPYVSGSKPTLPQRASGSNLSGHLIFSLLAQLTGNPRYIELAKGAADEGFDSDGRPRESMPYHSQMSDAVFMGCPILAQVGRLTGEEKYYDLCLTHLRFMQKLDLRPDGLYRHSPLDEAAWGRGNGFPALGTALCLSELPEDHPHRQEFLDSLSKHLAALAKHQDATGCWHQVIDRPESYRELTSTCMIAFAMLRGVREGWLSEKEYLPRIERAWYAIGTRVRPNGELVDVCTGTGKQKDLRAYYDRTAILGKDARGGAMALLIATEMAAYEKERQSP